MGAEGVTIESVMAIQGKAALVTGASKGVGKGIALELARAGARVAVNYNSDRRAGAEQTVGEITAAGGEAFAVQASVASGDGVARMFSEVAERFGRLDIHVNNAGVQTWKPLLELTEEDWDFVLDTNLKGCFLCTQAAARLMKQTGGGVHHQHRLGLQQGSLPEPGELYRQQGRHRDVHPRGSGGTGTVPHPRELRGAGGYRD